jgi:hypothetical protein
MIALGRMSYIFYIKALFFASTVIVIRDGKNTPFWEAK